MSNHYYLLLVLRHTDPLVTRIWSLVVVVGAPDTYRNQAVGDHELNLTFDIVRLGLV